MQNFRWLKNWIRNLRNGKEPEFVKVPLVASFWNGGVSTQYAVKKVTKTGAYIVTSDKWYPGTIITMSFQYDPYYVQVAQINGYARNSLRMRAKVTRHEPDGVAVRFVYLNDRERRAFEKFLADGTVRGTK
jgi:hypothetical protein